MVGDDFVPALDFVASDNTHSLPVYGILLVDVAESG